MHYAAQCPQANDGGDKVLPQMQSYVVTFNEANDDANKLLNNCN